MQQNPLPREVTLGGWLRRNARSGNWTFWGSRASVALKHLTTGSTLGGRLAEFAGRSVLVATEDQLAGALAVMNCFVKGDGRGQVRTVRENLFDAGTVILAAG